MEEAGTVSCILCSANLPQRALALRLDPPSVISFTKLLQGIETNPEMPIFSYSPYLLFCFTCHVKIEEIHAVFSQLEDVRAQLNAFKVEVESELLCANGTGGSCTRNKSAALRTRIIRELNLDSERRHGDELDELEFKAETDDQLQATSALDDIFPAEAFDLDPELPDPCYSEGDEDYFPDPLFLEEEKCDPALFTQGESELEELKPLKSEPSFAEIHTTSTGQIVLLKPCSIKLDRRIDEPGAASDSFNAVPNRCPVEGCTSRLRFYSKDQYRKHMRRQHSRSQSSQFSVTSSDVYPTPYDPSSQEYERMKDEVYSINHYPTKCPRPDCDSPTFYVDRPQLLRHLRYAHYKKLRPLTIDPDLNNRLNSTKYPAPCFQPDCFRTHPFTSKEELRRHLRHAHFIRCRLPVYVDPILNEIKRTEFPTACPREGCTRSKKIYVDGPQLRRHLRHVHEKSNRGAISNSKKKSKKSRSRSKKKAARSSSFKAPSMKKIKVEIIEDDVKPRISVVEGLDASADENEGSAFPLATTESQITKLRPRRSRAAYAESDDEEGGQAKKSSTDEDVDQTKESSTYEEEDQTNDSSTEDESLGFKCTKPNCRSRRRIFKSEERYKAHARYAHGEFTRPESWKKFHQKCQKPDCPSKVTFKHAYLYRRHMRAHALSENRIRTNPRKAELKGLDYPAKCPRPNCESQSEYIDREALRRHIKYVHDRKLEPYTIQNDLKKQLSALTYPTKCLQADCTSKLEFTCRPQLQRHLKATHRLRGQEPPWKNALTKELKAVEFPTRCIRVGCPGDKIFYELDVLRRHIRCFHNKPKRGPDPIVDNAYVCSICGNSFNSSRSLQHHERQHDKTVNVTCEHCGAGFKRPAGLRAHINAHHNAEAPVFLCPHCPKTFKVKRLLDVHIMRHTGAKKYFCRVCPKGFMYRIEVTEHEKFAHWEELGLEPIKCHICGKMYSKLGSLRQHLRAHSGEQRHCCTECEYKTEHKNDLAEHIATVHQTDFPFECTMCDKKFKLERRLRQHELEHKDDYGNTCELCDKRFATKRTLRIHNEKKHGTLPASRDDHRHGALAEYTV